MELAKPSRSAEDRRVVRAAIASAIPGLYMAVQGILAHLEGQEGAAWMFGAFAVVFLALAVGVYRGSDTAELAVVVAFGLFVFITVLAAGLRALFPWQLIMAVLLWAGMRDGAYRPGRRRRG